MHTIPAAAVNESQSHPRACRLQSGSNLYGISMAVNIYQIEVVELHAIRVRLCRVHWYHLTTHMGRLIFNAILDDFGVPEFLNSNQLVACLWCWGGCS